MEDESYGSDSSPSNEYSGMGAGYESDSGPSNEYTDSDSSVGYESDSADSYPAYNDATEQINAYDDGGYSAYNDSLQVTGGTQPDPSDPAQSPNARPNPVVDAQGQDDSGKGRAGVKDSKGRQGEVSVGPDGTVTGTVTVPLPGEPPSPKPVDPNSHEEVEKDIERLRRQNQQFQPKSSPPGLPPVHDPLQDYAPLPYPPAETPSEPGDYPMPPDDPRYA
jgi:hypothetical protein